MGNENGVYRRTLNREPDDQPREDADGSVDDMFQHLDDAKERYKTAKKRDQQNRSQSFTPLQQEIRARSDVAVLASNYEARLKELEDNEAVTHRSSKAWKTAKIGVDTHGRLPIYYRQEGVVTHKGYISDIIINPDDKTAAAQNFVEHITDADTYEEYNEKLDTTTFIVTHGERFEEQFSQSELELLSGEGYVSENYSYQPAYVIPRPGDFPEIREDGF